MKNNEKKEIKNFHAVQVKYLPATNTRGSRVKITSYRLGQSIIVPFDYSLNSSEDIAIAYLQKQGHKIAGQGEFKAGTTILFIADKKGIFKSLKQEIINL